MKQILLCLCGLTVLVLISSCRNDFEFTESSGNLEFSQDTVYLDTVFSSIGSSTRTFKVYNRSNEDIIIPRVALAQGANSRYRLAVDGVPGQIFENVELLAKDSMYVFVETTVDITDFTNDNQFLYEDRIEFDSGANLQQVELVTLIQDAIFLFPERDAQGVTECILLGTTEDGEEICLSGFFLDNNELNFTNEKPYVIYGFAAVSPNQTLTIDPGARLYFHNRSGIIVANEGSLKINGSLSMTESMENQVILEGDRLEPEYADVAGQWFGIWLTAGSRDHELDNVTIKNASVGILMDSSNPASNGATLQIRNSQILNSANSAIIASTADISASNSIFHNAGQSTIVARLGGSYLFNNCTITNYWSSSLRQDPTLFLSNTIPNTDLTEPLSQALFRNCIIYGNRNLELGLLEASGTAFNYKLENTLLRFNDFSNDFEGNPLYDFSNTSLFDNTVLNTDPAFEDPRSFLLRIDNSSGANGLADPVTATATDIEGTMRGNTPDAGAFESTDLEN
ncbi:right-handed parallel beta-helix repeat-containing protein [Nonlabens xiamenensis]|uniref:right-handed parallel beta-helix repeat-containing protein n=1 Tax=Nonlabens xiamenensis TaxID=2341043 RepID=UPI000F6128D9|nr:right-handed parallel beta-helix repeat-containing protein [Nonlabens xiamenensis]